MRTVPISRIKDWLAALPRLLLIGVVSVAVIAGIVIMVLVAIPNTDHGRVIRRAYHEPWDQWVPAQCVSRDTDGRCTFETPAHYEHHEEYWTVRVRDEENNEETLQVSEGVFQGCGEGMWYPGNGVACRENPS